VEDRPGSSIETGLNVSVVRCIPLENQKVLNMNYRQGQETSSTLSTIIINIVKGCINFIIVSGKMALTAIDHMVLMVLKWILRLYPLGTDSRFHEWIAWVAIPYFLGRMLRRWT